MEQPIKICHLYPDILNLYGDRGNVLCLSRRLEWRHIPVEVDRVLPDACGTYSVDRIPVRTYSGKGCLFMVAPEGSYIGLKGHLETREEFGVLVYLEFEEIFPMKTK